MKKIFSAFLLMTMMVASVGSFVSCSDIEDAIAKVEGTATENAAQIKDLESKIAALQTALATAQADAAAAKAEANAAKQAAATAKAEAIEAALAEIAKVQDDVDAANAEIKKINDALAGYATREAVELLENTVAEYKALTDENTEAIEAIEAELAALKEAGLTAEKFAEVVAKMEQIDKDLVSFVDALKDLANRIQSITWVPSTTDQINNPEIEPYAFSVADPASSTKYSPLMIRATYQVAPAELAAEMANAKVFFSSTPLTKGDETTFEAEVVSVNAERGQFTVRGYITKDSEAYARILNISGTKKVAVALNVVTDANATVGEETIETGSYVTSAYTHVKPVTNTVFTNVYDLIKLYNVKGNKAFASSDYAYEVAYNDAASERSLFANADFRVVFPNDGVLTLAEAAELVGADLNVTYEVAFDNKDNKKETSTGVPTKNAPIATTGKDLTATAKIVPVTTPNGQAVAANNFVGHKVVATVKNIKVNKYNSISDTYSSSYEIVKAKAGITFEAVSHTWSLHDTKDGVKLWNSNNDSGTGSVADASFQAKELAVTASNIDLTGKTFDPIDGTTTYNFYQKQKVDGTTYEAWAKVSVLSSKAVKLEAVKIPYVAGKDVKWTLVGTFDVQQTTYEAELVINMGAMPKNQEINLGAQTATLSYANDMKIPVNVLGEIINVHGDFYGNDVTNFFEKNAYGQVVASSDPKYPAADYITVGTPDLLWNDDPTPANNGATIEPNIYRKNANSAWGEKSYITIQKNANYDYDDNFILTQTLTISGVVYTFKAVVAFEKPTASIVANPTYVDNGVVTLGGKVVYPTSTRDGKTAGSKFALNEVVLNDYVNITVPSGMADDYKIRYTLKSDHYYYSNGTAYTRLPKFTGKTYVADKAIGYKGDVTYTAINVDQKVDWNSSRFNEVVYEIALVDSKANDGDSSNDVVIGDPVTVKLVIPQLITVSAGEIVEATYNNNVESVGYVASGLVVKDMNGTEIYNAGRGISFKPYTGFKGINDYYMYYPATDKLAEKEVGIQDGWLMYGQNFVVNSDANGTLETVTINGTEATIDYTIDSTTGIIKVSSNNANVTGDIVFTVPVAMSYDYDGYNPQVVDIQVVFKVK